MKSRFDRLDNAVTIILTREGVLHDMTHLCIDVLKMHSYCLAISCDL